MELCTVVVYNIEPTLYLTSSKAPFSTIQQQIKPSVLKSLKNIHLLQIKSSTIPMSVTVFIYAYRKPGLSLEDFKTHYEAHVDLIKRLTGDDFPLSHKRSYVARNTVEVAGEGASDRNALTPATVIAGQQADFDFDAYAELTFADQAAFQAFGAKVYAPEAAAQIAADEEKFLDKSKLSIVMLGEVIETTK